MWIKKQKPFCARSEPANAETDTKDDDASTIDIATSNTNGGNGADEPDNDDAAGKN